MLYIYTRYIYIYIDWCGRTAIFTGTKNRFGKSERKRKIRVRKIARNEKSER